MKFKHYSNPYQRSKKVGKQKDNFIILNIKDIKPNKDILKRCKLLKEASLRGEQQAQDLYTSCKNKLNCINVHNLGNILDDEFISTNYLAYDIDNLDIPTVKKLINYSKTICHISMISPSRRGVKLFFPFEAGSITKFNLKILYKNFGRLIMNRINNDLNINITIDSSSNDLNRLCFIGQIFINEDNEHLAYIPSDYYTLEELRSHNEPQFKSSEKTEFSTIDTINRVENCLKVLENQDKPIAMERYDMMQYGFSFASLLNDKEIDIEKAYSYFKRFMKLGEVDKESPYWMSKSGSNNKYHLGNEFKVLVNDWGNGSYRSNTTIGTFLYLRNSIKSDKIIIEKY